MVTRRAQVIGTGRYLPPLAVPNDALPAALNTTDAWIQARTGIVERRFAAPDQATSDLALHAAEAALAAAEISASAVDLIVVATLSPDFFFPGVGVLLGAKLGIPGTPALDVRNQCSGFLYSLQVAHGMIAGGVHDTVLIVGAEVHSTGLDFTERGRDVAVLFGDGAGAVVLRAGEGLAGVVRTDLGADGRHAEQLWCRSPASSQHPQRITAADLERGDHFPTMNGRAVFKAAVTTLRRITIALLEREGVTSDEVAMFIPHQANRRINDLVRKALSVPKERFFSNIERYGNTTAATIPIALDECIRDGLVGPGDLIVLIAFGSGYTWGASLIRL